MQTSDQYIHPCWLIEVNESGSDDVGNIIHSESKRKVLTSKKITKQSEFYQAKALGYKTLKTIKVRSFEYRGETEVILDGERMNVLRTEDNGEGAVTLVLWKGVNNQNVHSTESYKN